MPIIPEYIAVRGDHSPAAPSPRTAGFVGDGLTSLGEGLTSAGTTLATEADRLDSVRAEKTKNDARAAIRRAQADAMAFRTKNPDPGAWEEDARRRLEEAQTGLGDLRMRPAARQELDLIFKDARESAAADSAKAAKVQVFHSARQSTRERAELHMKHGEHQAARQTYLESKAFDPVEIESRVAEVDFEERSWLRREESERLNALAMTDPDGFLTRYGQEGEQATGMDPADVRYALGMARRVRTQQQVDILTGLTAAMAPRDGQAPAIMRAEDVDGRIPVESPHLRKLLHENLAVMQDERLRGERAAPAAQNVLAGEVVLGMSGPEPMNMEKHLDLTAKLLWMREGPVKEYLRGEQRRVMEGTPRDDDGPLPKAMAAVRELYDGRFFGDAENEDETTAVAALGNVTRELIRHSWMNPEAGEEELRKRAMEVAEPWLEREWSRRVFEAEGDDWMV